MCRADLCLDRDNDFGIDVELGTIPILILLYWMHHLS